MTKEEMVILPLYYAAEPSMEREVALYIDGIYVTRGPARQGEMAARWGWKGYSETVDPSRLTWELDRCSWGADRQFLCWGNPKFSNEEFLSWLNNVR